MIRKNFIVSMCIALCMTFTSTYANSGQDILASWVQYTTEGIEARAVVDGVCPDIIINGNTVTMTVRAEPTVDHDDTVCMVKLEEGVNSIVLEGQDLPVPIKKPKKILIIGDTGCRVSLSHGLYQACNKSSAWPFKRLAKSAASFSPDLIIYTGDYIYREAPCPVGNSGCEGTSYGDNLATWQADWLTPAKPLHLAAPIILARGNHETCSRAGMGWFRYLDASHFDGECKLNNIPWIANIGDHDVAVMDTANLTDEDGNELTERFEAELIFINELADKDTWIMTHRPFWAYGGNDDTGELTVQTEILQEAVSRVGLPTQTSLLISAHIHLAELLSFKGNIRPPQLTIGNGGTLLVADVPPITSIDGIDIETQLVLNQFGYAIMNKIGQKKWGITFYDQDGHDLEKCRLAKNAVRCK